MSKHRPPKYRSGSHLMLCDLSGRTCYAEDMRRMWNGLMVHKDYWEPRNPQDFVYAIRDQVAPAVVRPDTDGTVWLETNTAPDPSGLTAYPLNDDGTVAASFGVGWLETDAPDYTSADYTYTGAATGGAVFATPSSANLLTSQAVLVDATTTRSVEAIVNGVSATEGYSLRLGVGVLAADSSTVLHELSVSIGAYAGPDNIWNATGTDGPHTRTSAAAGFLLGMDFIGSTGKILMKTTDGIIESSTTFTPPVRVVATLQIQDNGEVAAGETASMGLVVPAADYTLPCPSGAKNLLGQVIP